MRFSRRLELGKQAEAWCRENSVPMSPFNIVTALDIFDVLNERDETPIEMRTWACSKCGKEYQYDSRQVYIPAGSYCSKCLPVLPTFNSR